MLKLMKTKYAFLAPIFLTLTMGLSSCGEKEVTIPYSKIPSFDHKIPESHFDRSYNRKPDFSSDEYKPFMDGDIFFGGAAIGDPNANTFEIGVQFETKTKGRKIFVEKMILDTPNLNTDRVINEFVDIDLFHESTKIYYKRFSPFEKISGDSIPLTAEFFTLTIDYRLDDGPTKQRSMRFDNTSFWAPNF